MRSAKHARIADLQMSHMVTKRSSTPGCGMSCSGAVRESGSGRIQPASEGERALRHSNATFPLQWSQTGPRRIEGARQPLSQIFRNRHAPLALVIGASAAGEALQCVREEKIIGAG